MTEEDEAFNEIERRSKVKQTLIVHPSKEAMLVAEVAVLTEMVRVLSARVAELNGEPVAWIDIDEKGAASGLRYWSEPDNRHEVALYTAKPKC